MRLATIPIAVAAVALVAPAAASADVLVSAIPKRLVCGAPIKPGVWAQPGTAGSRKVTIRVKDRRTGVVWWRRTVTAPTSGWRDWYLSSGKDGQCGPTKVVYIVNGVKVRYYTRFKSEGV